MLRGIKSDRIKIHVDNIIEAVGIGRFRTRMASKLSGGNKRKLSLGVALIGNPRVLLLDEPSSGMDAFAKRIMWRTLASVSNGRLIVLTTQLDGRGRCTCQSRRYSLAEQCLGMWARPRTCATSMETTLCPHCMPLLRLKPL